MTKKNRKHPPAATGTNNLDAKDEGAAYEEYIAFPWPPEFTALRRSAFTGAALTLFLLAVFVLTSANNLLWLKRIALFAAGASDPALLHQGATSLDVGVMLAFLGTVCGATLIHPSLGIGALLLVRPWIDGYTYPSDNLYFMWGIWFMFAIWALGRFLRGQRVVVPAPVVLVLLFFAVALATAPATRQWDRTHLQLLLWFSYAILLLLTVNVARTKAAWKIIAGAFILSMLCEGLFAWPHYHYVLPYMRHLLTTQPELLAAFFDQTEFSPELARRLNLNRAFGTMLFPNAFGAFLILGLPLAGAGAWLSIRDAGALQRAVRTRPRLGILTGQWHDLAALVFGGAIWMVCSVLVFIAGMFRIMYSLTPMSAEFSEFGFATLSFFAGAAVGVPMAVWASRRGFTAPLVWMRCVILCLATVVLTICLWLTFSRGAMLGLLLALFIATILLVYAPPIRAWLSRSSTLLPGLRTLSALLILLGATVAAWPLTVQLIGAPNVAWAQAANAPPLPAGSAQTDPPAPGKSGQASTEVTIEGENLGLAHLTSPASMRVRTTYWRVGLIMFWNNPLTGVGIGNFGLLYPKYQYFGAFPVQECHNGYIQAAAETGILGGLSFAALWIYVALFAMFRLVTETRPRYRLLLWGLAAGIGAFLLHSGMDINFSHPTLVMFVMIATALLLSLGAWHTPPVSVAARKPWLPMAILVAVALAVGSSTRLYLYDIGLNRGQFMNISDWTKRELTPRFRVGRYFLEDVGWYAWDKSLSQPRIRLGDVRTLLTDMERIRRMGKIYVQSGPNTGGFRELQANQSAPNDAVVVINPDRAYFARNTMALAILDWVENLKRIDARYPYNPDLAMHISEWHFVLAERLHGRPHDERRSEYAQLAVDWAQVAVNRSPDHKDMHQHKASALWLQAKIETDPVEKMAVFEEALAAYQTTMEMAPHVPEYMYPLAMARIELGEMLTAAGDTEAGSRYIQSGKELHAEATRLKIALVHKGIA